MNWKWKALIFGLIISASILLSFEINYINRILLNIYNNSLDVGTYFNSGLNTLLAICATYYAFYIEYDILGTDGQKTIFQRIRDNKWRFLISLIIAAFVIFWIFDFIKASDLKLDLINGENCEF